MDGENINQEEQKIGFVATVRNYVFIPFLVGVGFSLGECMCGMFAFFSHLVC